MNGNVPRVQWSVVGPDGDIVREGQDSSTRTPSDYFLMMFPMEHMGEIVDMTNENLLATGHNISTAGEILKFFGVLILMTRFEFWLQKIAVEHVL